MKKYSINIPKDTILKKIISGLNLEHGFADEMQFNAVCQSLIEAFQAHFKQSSDLKQFSEILPKAKEACPTPWGGVYNVKQQGNWMEKYLLITAGGYLPLEKHHQKDETINVIEGQGLLLYRSESDSSYLALTLLKAGDCFHFPVEYEHCILGGNDLLVYETSDDPAGADDIIILFKSNCGATSHNNFKTKFYIF